MKHRYIQRMVNLQSRRKQVYHSQTKLDEQPTTAELLQQLKEEKEKDEKK